MSLLLKPSKLNMFQPTIVKLNKLITKYAQQGLIKQAQEVFDEMTERNVFSWNAIIAAHLKNQDLARAESLFLSSSFRDTVTYNSMLSGYVGADCYESNALNLFAEMRRGGVGIDEFTVTSMLNLAAKLPILSLGVQLHSCMVKTSTDSSKFSASSLIDMYSKCGCFQEAYNMFYHCGLAMDLVSKNAMVAASCRDGEVDLGMNIFFQRLELNDTISWNTMISGLEQNGRYIESLKLFALMVESGVRFNEHTLVSVLGACSGSKNLILGKGIHARIQRDGFDANPYISSGIVDVYSKCGKMENAVSAHMMLGMQNNSFAVTSLIMGYSSLGNMMKARSLFDSLAEKNPIVWTALFSGYLKCQQCEDLFDLLRELTVAEKEIILEIPVLMSLLGACALQASLDLGKEVHSYIWKNLVIVDEKLTSSIMDMYAKCGRISYAEKLFALVLERDLVMYNVMIAGYAHNGCEGKAISLFNEMTGREIRPQAATFIALLSACRHAGLLEVGEKYFHSMEKDYGISPEIDHYTCMADLYGRAKQLSKGIEFIRRMPIQPDGAIWSSFLNTCKSIGNLELAKEAEHELLSIKGESGSRYVQLANWYATDRNWCEMQRIRKKMKEKEVRKFPGCSWVYIDNGVSVFTSGNLTHRNSEAIYLMLDCLNSEIDHVVYQSTSNSWVHVH